MEIVSYRDLKSKDGLLLLMDHAFGWPFNPMRFEEFIRIDPRLRNGAVGFAGVEKGHVIGFVGVMDLATRTLDGKIESAGGIYGVATLPGHVRKRVSMTLMEHVHEYFKGKGYRFSFLCTSRTIVAHSMYAKLGYVDLLERPSAYGILMSRKSKAASSRMKTEKPDLDRILKIYNEHVKGRAGLVVRDKDHLNLLWKSEEFTAKDCVISEKGYVLFKRNTSTWIRGTWIRELVALNTKEMHRLLGLVETKAKELVYDRTVMDERLLEVYRSRGYTVGKRSHAVMMGKPLTADTSVKQTYGNSFYLTGLDFF
jgi:GNAT superfamily N-acetyltransferase